VPENIINKIVSKFALLIVKRKYYIILRIRILVYNVITDGNVVVVGKEVEHDVDGATLVEVNG
jgi:hypothetical protein